MTVTTSKSQPAGSNPGNPALTEKEAGQLGYVKDEYRQGCHWRGLTVEHHIACGTIRSAWTPPPHIGRGISESFVENAVVDMTARLEEEVDEDLAASQASIEDIKADLDALEGRTDPLLTPESGVCYSPADAVLRVHDCDEKIEADEQASKHHHRRAPYWLKKIAPWLPWVEFVGFLWFCAVWLNVPILQPWRDFGAWSLSVALVASIIIGQTWLVHHAGTAHNHGREAFAENNRHEGEKAYRRRNAFIVAAAVTVTAAVTAGMILRGLMTLGEASIGTTTFMIFIAIVAGYVMPTLGYLAIATDGSKVSRERDDLVDQLDARLGDHEALLEGCQANLAAVEETRDRLCTSTFPAIVDSTQAIVDGAYRLYGLTWLLIGGLVGDEPVKIAPTFGIDEQGRPYGRIGTSIPGADTVDLKPLFDRVNRQGDLDAQRAALAACGSPRIVEVWLCGFPGGGRSGFVGDGAHHAC
ncbi:MAG: hypothetical protein IPK37_09460 [Austwickia sp.]|jgi:hypothetical protein|nr:MAG: hypothetical protein IPK37_09460 [Austwickia sp.]